MPGGRVAIEVLKQVQVASNSIILHKVNRGGALGVEGLASRRRWSRSGLDQTGGSGRGRASRGRSGGFQHALIRKMLNVHLVHFLVR